MSENLKIDPYGFREYDARWLYEKDINQLGITNLGKGLGTQIIKNTKKNNPRVIVGHDYRSYSEKIKSAVVASFNYGEEKFGLIKFGSEDPIKYLGEADVTFVEFLRDVLAVSLKRLNHNV